MSNLYHWIKQDCPICETEPTHFIGYRGGDAHRDNLGVKCEIWQCGKCSLIFPNPMPHPVNGLSQHYESEDDFFVNHNVDNKDRDAKQLLGEAESLLGRKGRVLDIGAGRGELVKRAALDGWSVVGIEPSKAFADFAEKHSGVEIRREQLENCGFEENSFDVVFLTAVLEHLYNPAEVVAEISRILKPNGIFYFDVPNEKGLYFIIGNLYQKLRGRKWSVNLAPSFPPYHLFGFSPKSVKMLLNKYDLTIKELTIYGGTSLVPSGNNLRSKVESLAANIVTKISSFGNLGTYISGWAEKK